MAEHAAESDYSITGLQYYLLSQVASVNMHVIIRPAFVLQLKRESATGALQVLSGHPVTQQRAQGSSSRGPPQWHTDTPNCTTRTKNGLQGFAETGHFGSDTRGDGRGPNFTISAEVPSFDFAKEDCW
jgi:hypothetical protein